MVNINYKASSAEVSSGTSGDDERNAYKHRHQTLSVEDQV
jgi:hypothetical protein